MSDSGSGHAGALKELEAHARNLSAAPPDIRTAIDHLDGVITDTEKETAHVTEESAFEVGRILEDGRQAIAEQERTAERLGREVNELGGKLKDVGIELTNPLENDEEQVVVTGETTKLAPSAKSLRTPRR